MSYTTIQERDAESQQTIPKDLEGGIPLDAVDETLRAGFVRKVFGILSAQLAVTFGIISIFNFNHDVKAYVDMRSPQAHTWPFITAVTVSFACLITLTCCANQARTHPNNLIFLSIFTIAEGVVLGVACAAYAVEAILLAVGITSLVVGGLTAYAMYTKTDFTGSGPYLFNMLFAMLIYGFIMAFFPPLRTLQLLYSAIGVVLFSFYLIFDVQLVVASKHNRFRFGIDDYVFASLNIYLDIINLFIRILQLVGRRDN
jgi:FtsH-binding integral membrane protein